MKQKLLSLMLACSIVVSLALLATGCAAQTSTPEAATPLWEAGAERNRIVVISDLHLGIADSYSETVTNRALLVEFLKRLQNTKDVRELVIAGDFLDAWFLPVSYTSYTDEEQFYRQVIANNQVVIDEMNSVADSGIKLVYVIGNHDMTLEKEILQQAIPNIEQATDAKGLGAYYTGDRNEIVIEHGHRYDVFSAPDTVSNAKLCGNDDTILPAGYFYARYAATWVLQGHPEVAKELPAVANVPDHTDTDQYGAYIYYSVLKSISERVTPNESLDEKIFDMHIAGFDDAYTYLDFFPAEQADGTISAPVLFQHIQRTWDARQKLNNVKVHNTFIEAVSGTLNWDYFFAQAKAQYIDNPDETVDIIVFGHTHVPALRNIGDGAYYINTGTWIDNNTNYPDAARTFTVITADEKDTATLYSFAEDGALIDIGQGVSN
ncbi:MAG: metallophosphoesterase [Gaiellales bacterium]|nr:metallophosphoesterase [Gaiellales bacterium]